MFRCLTSSLTKMALPCSIASASVQWPGKEGSPRERENSFSPAHMLNPHNYLERQALLESSTCRWRINVSTSYLTSEQPGHDLNSGILDPAPKYILLPPYPRFPGQYSQPGCSGDQLLTMMVLSQGELVAPGPQLTLGSPRHVGPHLLCGGAPSCNFHKDAKQARGFLPFSHHVFFQLCLLVTLPFPRGRRKQPSSR